MIEPEFEFNKCKQVIELRQGRRMSSGETVIARAVFDYCSSRGTEQTQQQEYRQRVFQAVQNYHRGKK